MPSNSSAVGLVVHGPSLHLALLGVLALSPVLTFPADRLGDGPPVLAQRRLVVRRWRGLQLHTGAGSVRLIGRRTHEQLLTSPPLLLEELRLRDAVLSCQAPVLLQHKQSVAHVAWVCHVRQ